MRDILKYFPVNWIDGMKINKAHFIAQDNAWRNALNDMASLNISPIHFGILPSSSAGEENFNIKISLDNQETLRVAVLALQAVTPGGIAIHLPVLGNTLKATTDGAPAVTFRFSEAKNEALWWVVIMVNPFERVPAGSPDLSENPPRFPHILPSYTVEIISDRQFSEYAYHPYALVIGKIAVNGNDIRVDDHYIPPCYSVSASNDLLSLHSELDHFLGALEMHSSQIVQKIFQKKQQNEISDLVMFLCDRMMLYLSQSITAMRWTIVHESPVELFSCIAGLARIMKNSIDLRIGSGKEEMMNYLSEWSELNPGELETILTGLATICYDNNDINKNIQKITRFVKVTSKLFETLSKLDFIGKRKAGFDFVVKEEKQIVYPEKQQPQQPNKRRFFG